MYIFFYTLRSFDTINIFDRIFYHPDLIVQRHYVPHLELSCCWCSQEVAVQPAGGIQTRSIYPDFHVAVVRHGTRVAATLKTCKLHKYLHDFLC